MLQKINFLFTKFSFYKKKKKKKKKKSIPELHSSRDVLYSQIYDPPIWCFKKSDFKKWVNFDCILKYVPDKLEQISAKFLKAETISN